MRKRNLMIAIAMTVCMTMPVMGNMEMDGNFKDWENVEKTDVSETNFYDSLSVAKDEEYLYIHGKEKFSWYAYYNYANPTIVCEDGTTVSFVIGSNGDAGNNKEYLIVRNRSWQPVTGATGMSVKTGNVNEWEVRIPIAEIGAMPVSCRIQTDYTENREVAVVTIDSTTAEAASQETTETAATEQPTETVPTTNAVNIVIDGHYEDWQDKPHSYVINWDMPDEQRNDTNCRKLSLLTDGDNVYMHIVMRQDSEVLNGNYYIFKIDGKTVKMHLLTEDDEPFPGESLGEGIHPVKVYYLNGQGTPDNTELENYEALFTRKQGRADEFEVRIPIEAFEKIHGKIFDDITEISVANPNMFLGEVSTAGTSTRPYLGIVLAIGTVATAAVVLKKRKKTV